MFPKAPKPVRLKGVALQRLRLAVFERDGYRCAGAVNGERCNKPVTWANGHMHHVISKGKLGPGDVMSNLITLCWSCHAKEHVRPLFRWIRETA